MEAQAAVTVMESKEDALQNMIMKGKRTKRQRPQSPIPFDIISTACDRVDDHQEDDEEMDDNNYNNINVMIHHKKHKSDKDVIISLPTTATFECATEEEQDMANCLILLAQGHEFRDEKLHKKNSQPKEQTLTNSPYECNTCNRMFPSFQALGGHRASHKKLKINPIMESDEDSSPPLFINKCTILPVPPPLSLQLGHYSKPSPKNNKSKIHECSICGTEFASGQALGGHMRRHRGLMIGNNNNKTGALIDTINTLSLSSVALEPDHQENNIKGLCLDLNLPVPEEEPPIASNDDIFHFAAKQTQQDRSAIVYTTPALVDCRY